MIIMIIMIIIIIYNPPSRGRLVRGLPLHSLHGAEDGEGVDKIL